MTLLAVCGIDEIPERQALCRRLPDGQQISLARLADPPGRIVAFENRCPHFGAPIGLGKIRGNTIICPWHFFRFDLRNGTGAEMESVMHLRTYPTLVHDRHVFVDI